MFLYDGKTGDKVSQLVGHTGGVFSASWSPDGKSLQTVFADTSVLIWDIVTASAVDTMYPSEKTEAIEYGIVYTFGMDDTLRSISSMKFTYFYVF